MNIHDLVDCGAINNGCNVVDVVKDCEISAIKFKMFYKLNGPFIAQKLVGKVGRLPS